MIRGYCFTNIDKYNREQWPTEFTALPRIGDRVRSANGVSLKVVCVTHGMMDPTREAPRTTQYVGIELYT